MAKKTKTIVYDPIEIDPMDELFEKIYAARGGEMLFVHVPPYSKNNKKVAKCFSILNSKDSLLLGSLPMVVRDILKDKRCKNE